MWITSWVERSTRARLAQREMLALGLVEHLDRLGQSRHHVAAQRQRIGRVVQQLMAARLRLQHHGEGGIAARID